MKAETGSFFSMGAESDSERVVFGTALANARHDAGLTQEQLAARMNVAQSSVSGWECGHWDIPMETVFDIEHAVEVPPGTLSRLLGFMPITHANFDVEEAIEKDDALTPLSKVALRTMYQELVRLKDDRPRSPRRLRR